KKSRATPEATHSRLRGYGSPEEAPQRWPFGKPDETANTQSGLANAISITEADCRASLRADQNRARISAVSASWSEESRGRMEFTLHRSYPAEVGSRTELELFEPRRFRSGPIY